uniref:Uncharacterized protein n=3 Tax=Aegilops tauschii subsp. strangulata TaxID=200361 RepID=A0A453GBS3_AEGTS
FSPHHINRKSSTTTIDYAAAASMGASQPNKEDEGKTMTVDKEMKKIFRVPQDRLDYYLSFKASPVGQSQALRDPSAAAELDKIIVQIQAEQEKMRREYEAKGYATFEADVAGDEEEEDAAAGAIAPCIIQQGEEKEEDTTSPCITPQGDQDLAAPWFIPHRGRRRFRPGVVKQAGGVKKVII